MNDMTRFEERFEERIRAFARTGVQSVDSAAVARAVAVGHPKRAATRPAWRRLVDEIHRTAIGRVRPWRTRPMSRTTIAAAAVVAVLALGGALSSAAPAGPSPTPSAEPSPSLPGIVAPSSTPSGPSAAPTASPVTNPAGVWIATGTMGTPRMSTQRCGSPMAGCSFWAAPAVIPTGHPPSCTTRSPEPGPPRGT